MPSAEVRGGRTKMPGRVRTSDMTKISPKPAKPGQKDWEKYHQYLDELKKETAECIIENRVP